MNGLKTWVYFLAHYLDFALSAALSMIIFLLMAVAFRLEIVSINPGPIIILLIVWLNTAISLSFALSSIFDNARNALIGTFIILLMSIVISIAAAAIWDNEPPSPFFIWPPFACYTAVSIINARAISLDAPAITIQTIGKDHKLVAAILYLSVEWVIFFLLAIYGQVIISFQGLLSVARHPNRVWSESSMVLADRCADSAMEERKGWKRSKDA